MTPISFPAHTEQLVRAALLRVIETIPLGQEGPMLECVFLPLDLPARPRFELVEGDETPVGVDGVADQEDGA